MSDRIRFTLDAPEAEAATGQTIRTVAARAGASIPHLCHHAAPGYRPDGNSRACMVQIEAARPLAASRIPAAV